MIPHSTLKKFLGKRPCKLGHPLYNKAFMSLESLFMSTISVEDLEKISQLAYLDTDINHLPQLVNDINAIVGFMEQLSTVETQGVSPLVHPLALHQRLREDVVTEENCVSTLKEAALQFENELYLVPQVLDQG